MFITSHIRVASRVMKYVDPEIKWRYRVILSIGSISPDIVMIFPQHQVFLTYDKVQKILNKVEYRDRRSLIDAWRLGVCLHYMCDYFCRAHNDSTILHGLKHSAYEWQIAKKVKYFGQLCNLDYTFDGAKFRELFKNEHNMYIKTLIRGNNDIGNDVSKAMLMGVNLISSHMKSLGRSSVII